MYYVYVLRSDRDNGFYIGFSGNLRRRLKEHQEGLAAATAHRGPWHLIYYEAYCDERDARGRERYLKSGSGRLHLQRQCRHYFNQWPGSTA
jgi:putative endonuclease